MGSNLVHQFPRVAQSLADAAVPRHAAARFARRQQARSRSDHQPSLTRGSRSASFGSASHSALVGGGLARAALRRFRLGCSFDAAPTLDRLAIHERLQPISVRLRSLGKELWHPQVALLVQPRQLGLRRFKHRVGALHGEMQSLQAIYSKHVPRSAPTAGPSSDLQRATQSDQWTGCGTPIVSTTGFALVAWNTRRAAIRRIVRGAAQVCSYRYTRSYQARLLRYDPRRPDL